VPTPTETTATVIVSGGSGVAVGVTTGGDEVALALGLGGLELEHALSTRAATAPGNRRAHRRFGIETILE